MGGHWLRILVFVSQCTQLGASTTGPISHKVKELLDAQERAELAVCVRYGILNSLTELLV